MQFLEQSIGDVKIYFSRIIEKLFPFSVYGYMFNFGNYYFCVWVNN